MNTPSTYILFNTKSFIGGFWGSREGCSSPFTTDWKTSDNGLPQKDGNPMIPPKTESKVEFLILQLNRMKKLSGVGDRPPT